MGNDGALIDELTNIVSRAAAAVLEARAGALDPRAKHDRSPVTEADKTSEAIILEGLSRTLPGVAVVSEEAFDAAPIERLGEGFALVDPLDGTRELVAGRDEFCINVALVGEGGRLSLGIIAAPAFGLIWRTAAGGGAERLRLPPGAPVDAAAERTPIRPRALPTTGIVAAISRSHLDPSTREFLARVPNIETRASGSAMKLCWIAEGSADVYPRLGPVREWDVAAGDAIVAAAGGLVTTPAGEPLLYGHLAAGFLVPGFIAWGDPAAPIRLAGSPA
jgi:3'(2'), 5'-bisphosphate nucleotidase